MLDYTEIKQKIVQAKNIVITSHRSPDGDAIGSSLALSNLLKNKGIQSSVVVPNDFPDFLKWISNSDRICIAEKEPEKTQLLFQQADLIFALDYNALKRIEGMADLFELSTAFKIMIDHHQFPEEFTDISISDATKSSTCEMMFDFFKALDFLEDINTDVAEAVYTGLVTDTGSFKHQGTTGQTHQVAAFLIDKGIHTPTIHQKLFDNNAISRIKVLGHCLNHMEVLPELKTAIFSLSEVQGKDLGMQKGDSEGVVNFGLSIKGIECAVFFKEEEGKIKISFRSKGDFDIRTFAARYFNGGGHLNASGGVSFLSLQDTITKYKKELLIYINQ